MLKRIRKRALSSFTDSLYLMNFVMVQIITQECFALVLLSAPLNMSSTALAAIKIFLTCAWTELAAHTGLIIWKAKVENQAKYKKENIDISVTEDAPVDLMSKVDATYLDISGDEVDQNGIYG